MKNRSRDKTCHMTAGVKKQLLNNPEAVRNALKRFRDGDFGSSTHRPENELIKNFGEYELPFGTLWIISYDLFRNRDFITLLLPEEYDQKQ